MQTLLTRPNIAVGAVLLLLTALAWLQLLSMGSPMADGKLAIGAAMEHAHHVSSAAANLGPHAWQATDFAAAFLMWMLMAVAMMLPTAAPAILSLAELSRRSGRPSTAAGSLSGFVAGYLAVWWVFGALATVAQWGLVGAALRIPLLSAGGPAVGGVLLLIAGLYQFSAMKNHCLTQCRSPVAFFLAHWREGSWGALRMGLRHGMHCVGCCWALMALMLFAGTMNIAWTAALMVLMLAEKVIPGGPIVGRAVGTGLLIWGGVLLAQI